MVSASVLHARVLGSEPGAGVHVVNTSQHWGLSVPRVLDDLVTYRALSTQQQPYLASLLHLSNIPRQLRSSRKPTLKMLPIICRLNRLDSVLVHGRSSFMEDPSMTDLCICCPPAARDYNTCTVYPEIYPTNWK